MNDLAKRIAALSQNSALFELRLKQKGLNAEQAQSILKRKASDALLLSLAQEGCGFTSCNLIPYITSRSCFASQATQPRRPEQSLNEIIRRHEIHTSLSGRRSDHRFTCQS